MRKEGNYKGHLAMFVANIFWGLMSPISKNILSSGWVDAISLTTFRMVGAAILFWSVSFFCPKERVPKEDLIKLFFAALLGIVFNQGSFIYGVSMTSPINASIVATTTPIITMIIAAIYLKEPITGKKAIGVLIGASGALLLISGSNNIITGSSSSIWGDLSCLSAQCFFSLYFVLFKDLISRYSPVTLMKWMFLYSSICCMPFSHDNIIAIDFATMPVDIYMGILFVVVFGTFICYFLMPIGQKTLRPTVAIMYNHVQPIVASIISVVWGFDTFGYTKTFAIVLVSTGVYIVTKSKSRAQMESEKTKQD